MTYAIAVVGGGIVGLAIARELALRNPDDSVVVLEKEAAVAQHQTSHNSGVVHAGIYYPPGSLKAQLCARGRALIREYATAHGLPYRQFGKLVIATSPEERERLATLEQRASQNAVPGLRRVTAAEIREIEPHAVGLAALYSPETASTDFAAIARAFAADLTQAGGEVRCAAEVVGLRRMAGRVELRLASGGEVAASRVVLCAGLQSDRVATLAGGGATPRIVPFRGEYLFVKPAKRDLVRGLIYPVPDPRYPFLGVHFTRRVNDTVDLGPNAVLALSREGHRRRSVASRDVWESAKYVGFWRMARQHWRTGVRELRGSLSMGAYVAEAARYVPEITAADVERGDFGIRAQAVERDGSLVDDFRISVEDGIVAVRNAPSPAATSSLAIAEYVVGLMTGDDGR